MPAEKQQILNSMRLLLAERMSLINEEEDPQQKKALVMQPFLIQFGSPSASENNWSTLAARSDLISISICSFSAISLPYIQFTITTISYI